jgi:uncharacterized membrane protein YhaH (DUF805 family)
MRSPRRGASGWLRLWFTLDELVDPETYLKSGAFLMALKYAVDVAAVYLVTGRTWTPLDYLVPSYALREPKIQLFPAPLLFAMALWTIPFLWIGASMSLRRVIDAGRSPWLSLAFFVPLVNYAFMLGMCFLPSRIVVRPVADARAAPEDDGDLRAALLGAGAGMVVAVGMAAFCALVLRSYSPALFLATPFVLGIMTAFVYNHGALRSSGQTIGVVALTVLISCGALLLFALEGVICMAMVLPLALPSAILGGMLGRAIAGRAPGTASHAALVVLALPGLAAVDSAAPPGALREVVSVIEVSAPPSAVWRNVVSFSELPDPPGWIFRLGIAYPVRARIEGRGVGAVRRCEFSTGAFVEPITAWDEPRRLGFDVAAQPPPMTELSPYRAIHPAHLDGYFRSRRGEFRLIALPDGRTRLEGRTWYELDIAPGSYWHLWGDAVIHAIHRRVLLHVKRLSES